MRAQIVGAQQAVGAGKGVIPLDAGTASASQDFSSVFGQTISSQSQSGSGVKNAAIAPDASEPERHRDGEEAPDGKGAIRETHSVQNEGESLIRMQGSVSPKTGSAKGVSWTLSAGKGASTAQADENDTEGSTKVVSSLPQSAMSGSKPTMQRMKEAADEVGQNVIAGDSSTSLNDPKQISSEKRETKESSSRAKSASHHPTEAKQKDDVSKNISNQLVAQTTIVAVPQDLGGTALQSLSPSTFQLNQSVKDIAVSGGHKNIAPGSGFKLPADNQKAIQGQEKSAQASQIKDIEDVGGDPTDANPVSSTDHSVSSEKHGDDAITTLGQSTELVAVTHAHSAIAQEANPVLPGRVAGNSSSNNLANESALPSHTLSSQNHELPSSLLRATPTTLEVGVTTDTHGWLKVRAELNSAGQLSASLTGGSPAAVSRLRDDLSQMNSYLEQEKVQVNTLTVHALSFVASAATDPSLVRHEDVSGSANYFTGSGGGFPEGGQPQQQGNPQLFTSANIAGDMAEGHSASDIPGQPLQPATRYGLGSWLNVRV